MSFKMFANFSGRKKFMAQYTLRETKTKHMLYIIWF
jgi:hypothetical protein